MDSKTITESKIKIDLTQPYVVRLNGYNFMEFRESFHQPYDPTFQWAMIKTMNELLLAFRARTAHTNAFQILLMFDGSTEGDKPELTTCPHKLLTMYTSFATVRFNCHIVEQMNSPNYISSYTPSQVAKVGMKQAMFYGEYIQKDLAKYLVYQCHHKTLGLAIKLWAHSMIPAEETKKSSPAELVKLLSESSKPLRWELDVPLFVSYGVFTKKKGDTRSRDSGDETQVVLKTFPLNESMSAELLVPTWLDDLNIITKESFFNVHQEGDLLLPR